MVPKRIAELARRRLALLGHQGQRAGAPAPPRHPPVRRWRGHRPLPSGAGAEGGGRPNGSRSGPSRAGAICRPRMRRRTSTAAGRATCRRNSSPNWRPRPALNAPALPPRPAPVSLTGEIRAAFCPSLTKSWLFLCIVAPNYFRFGSDLERRATMASAQPAANSAHVIVLGNEKGGSGKSTLAVHIVVALLKAGHRVASIDTDSRQLSLTRYLENRARWARKSGLALELPSHFSVKLGEGERIRDVEASEFARLHRDRRPAGRDRRFRRHRHAGQRFLPHAAQPRARRHADHAGQRQLRRSRRARPRRGRAVRRHRRQPVCPPGRGGARQAARRACRTRPTGSSCATACRRCPAATSATSSRVSSLLAGRLGFRIANGISERVIFREFFPMGLTAFDPFERAVLGTRPTMSHVAARAEIRELVECLRPADGQTPAVGAADRRQPAAVLSLPADADVAAGGALASLSSTHFAFPLKKADSARLPESDMDSGCCAMREGSSLPTSSFSATRRAARASRPRRCM